MKPEQIIAKIKERQSRREYMPCPRCGELRMDEESPFRNALSRIAQVCVCDSCGTVEAIEQAENRLKPIAEWYTARHPEEFVDV